MTTNPTPPRKNRRWIWVLFPSLALNLALLGLMVGMHLRAPAPQMPRHDITRILIGALDPQDRAQIRAHMHQKLGEKLHNHDHKRPRKEMQALLDALRDPGANDQIRQILQSEFTHHRAMRQFGADALMEMLNTMDPPARMALADRIEHRLNRR